jgi:hypothetical protein
MAVASLNRDQEKFSTSKDNIVIVENHESLRGGRSLDTNGYPLSVINAGHVIIKNSTTTDYKPMPIVVSGAITKQGSYAGGTGYVNAGTYTNVALTGGTGSNARATIVVAGGSVTGVTITNPGSGYKVGDSLSAAASTIGTNGTGFTLGIAEVDGSSSGYAALPAGHEYVGIQISTIGVKEPFGAILIHGTVNEVASPFAVASIKSAFNTATQNRIRWTSDKI